MKRCFFSFIYLFILFWTVKGLSVPAKIFPIYYPIGNLATGFFVILSLLAGLVGIASSFSGLYDVLEWKPSSLLSAAASSLTAWALTLLAMGYSLVFIKKIK